MKNKILIVEDEKDILELLKYNLEKEGYKALCADNGGKALDLIKKDRPDLIILDLMLPGLNGLEICKILRKDDTTVNLPIVILTAKDTESDIIKGLELGADDYITKPFSPKVLIARIKAVLRRKEGIVEQKEEIIISDLRIDISSHKVTIKDKPIDLTITEFRILEFLAKNPGKVFTRDQILNNAWKDEPFIVDRAVDVHIRGLRKKLGKYSDFIETVRSIGYRFKEL